MSRDGFVRPKRIQMYVGSTGVNQPIDAKFPVDRGSIRTHASFAQHTVARAASQLGGHMALSGLGEKWKAICLFRGENGSQPNH
jgi:hypothetical protein